MAFKKRSSYWKWVFKINIISNLIKCLKSTSVNLKDYFVCLYIGVLGKRGLEMFEADLEKYNDDVKVKIDTFYETCEGARAN